MAHETIYRRISMTAVALALSGLGACGGSSRTNSDGSSDGASSGDGDSSDSDSSSSSNGSGGTSSGGSGDGDTDGSASSGDSDSDGLGSDSGGSSGDSDGSSSSTSGGLVLTPIPGGGVNSGPLGAGCGPETASDCHPEGSSCVGDEFVEHEVLDAGTVCFFGEGLEDPSATVEHITEVVDGEEYIHVRVTFDPDFVDTAFGECSPDTGWPQRRGHTFTDLEKSDHVELMLYDCSGELSMHFKVDFISADGSAACGYASAGVTGGDGSITVGNADHVLAATTSLDRNMNGCGYCDTENSPCTDMSYASDPDAPEWDFRMVYEVWLDPAAFGGDGFCDVDIEYVHASPAKGSEDTILVEPDDCGSGGAGGSGGSGGTDGGGGSGGDGGSGGSGTTGGGSGDCPPNYELFLTSEGEYRCGGPPDKGVCPEGYVIDLTSEGELCISEEVIR